MPHNCISVKYCIEHQATDPVWYISELYIKNKNASIECYHSSYNFACRLLTIFSSFIARPRSPFTFKRPDMNADVGLTRPANIWMKSSRLNVIVTSASVSAPTLPHPPGRFFKSTKYFPASATNTAKQSNHFSCHRRPQRSVDLTFLGQLSLSSFQGW